MTTRGCIVCFRSSLSVAALLWLSAPVLAQTPAAPQAAPEPPKIWTVSASAGLAFARGNSDTSSINLGYNVTYDPQKKNVVKSDGLFLRGTDEGELSTKRLSLNGRDEYKVSPRVFVFGQLQYLEDEFKAIDYLLAPTGGVGYKLVMLKNTELAIDGGIGAIWEKNTGHDVDASAAVSLDDKFTQHLSPTATFTQTFSALWKTQDFGDSLYITGLSLVATVNTRTALKVEWLDTYKRKPPANIKPNDMTLLFSIVFKN